METIGRVTCIIALGLSWTWSVCSVATASKGQDGWVQFGLVFSTVVVLIAVCLVAYAFVIPRED